MAECDVCFRHCKLKEGQTGFCGGRVCKDGKVVASNYGKITSIALDPIEKKPLNRFMPGSMILSVGSYGCNLRCPFCQNSDISWSHRVFQFEQEAETISPEQLLGLALQCKNRGNIGVAFTYNEPLIGYEFIRDTAKLIKDNGMKNVLVSNGTASIKVLDSIGPYIDAMNIDLKCFNSEGYRKFLDGDLDMVKCFISEAIRYSHVEVTTLVIPGFNDSDEEMNNIASFLAKVSVDIPLHISRFFPRFKLTDRDATEIEQIYHLVEIARGQLKYVYSGNC